MPARRAAPRLSITCAAVLLCEVFVREACAVYRFACSVRACVSLHVSTAIAVRDVV